MVHLNVRRIFFHTLRLSMSCLLQRWLGIDFGEIISQRRVKRRAMTWFEDLITLVSSEYLEEDVWLGFSEWRRGRRAIWFWIWLMILSEEKHGSEFRELVTKLRARDSMSIERWKEMVLKRTWQVKQLRESLRERGMNFC